MASIFTLEEARQAGLFEDACIAWGVFDGFHQGHRYLIGAACDQARSQGLTSVALTFDVDPDEVLRPGRVRKIMSNDQRLRALAASGVDAVVALPFDERLSALDPLSFLERTFSGFPPFALHVGVDFRFGHKGSGSIVDLNFWADRTGTQIVGHQLLMVGDAPVTATRIRGLLAEGDVSQAQTLLAAPYVLEGLVVSGRAEGREMGFRTANLEFPPACHVLADGVYAGFALVGERRYKAAISMGVAPSFEDAVAACEVHLLDFDEDIYGQILRVEFVRRLRPMKKFDDLDELIATIMSDISWVANNLTI